MSRAQASPVFYGWFVVAAAFAVTCLGFGSAYTFSIFMGALQQDFAASRGSVSLVFSLAGFLYFVLGMVTGPLADRRGPRPLVVAGMILTAAGLAAAALARTLMEVYAAYGVGVGLGVGCSYVPALGAVQRWFVRRRGLASGLAVAGIGVGTVIMPAAASGLIGAVGWRTAYLILGAFVGCVGVGMALLVESDPRDRQLAPDGDRTEGTLPPPASGGGTIGAALRSPTFISLYVACLTCSFGAFVPFVHLVPYALGHGVGQGSAALLLGMIGIGSTAGRFFLGGLADRLGRHRALVAMFAGMAASLGAWAAATTGWSLSAFALVYGVFYGGWVAILPAVVADYFGGRRASSIIGILYTSVAFGTLFGPSAAGYVFDATHSYLVPIFASAGANVLATAISAAMLRSPSAVPADGGAAGRVSRA